MSWFHLHTEMLVNGNMLLLAVCGRLRLYLAKYWWWNVATGLSQCAVCSLYFKQGSNFSSRNSLCPYFRGRGQFLVTQAHLKNVNSKSILKHYQIIFVRWEKKETKSNLCVLWSQILCLSRCFYRNLSWLTANYSPVWAWEPVGHPKSPNQCRNVFCKGLINALSSLVFSWLGNDSLTASPERSFHVTSIPQ